MGDQRGAGNMSPFDEALWAAAILAELRKISVVRDSAHLHGGSKPLTRRQRFIRKCQRLSSWLINRLPPAWREVE